MTISKTELTGWNGCCALLRFRHGRALSVAKRITKLRITKLAEQACGGEYAVVASRDETRHVDVDDIVSAVIVDAVDVHRLHHRLRAWKKRYIIVTRGGMAKAMPKPA